MTKRTRTPTILALLIAAVLAGGYLIVTQNNSAMNAGLSCGRCGLDGGRGAWQSRDLCVASCSGCCAHRTGREGARNGVTLNHNAIPISCSVAAGVVGLGQFRRCLGGGRRAGGGIGQWIGEVSFRGANTNSSTAPRPVTATPASSSPRLLGS